MDYFADFESKRDAAGISARAVCARAEVAPSTLTRSRAGVNRMTRRIYDRLIAALSSLTAERRRALRAESRKLERIGTIRAAGR